MQLNAATTKGCVAFFSYNASRCVSVEGRFSWNTRDRKYLTESSGSSVVPFRSDASTDVRECSFAPFLLSSRLNMMLEDSEVDV